MDKTFEKISRRKRDINGFISKLEQGKILLCVNVDHEEKKLISVDAYYWTNNYMWSGEEGIEYAVASFYVESNFGDIIVPDWTYGDFWHKSEFKDSGWNDIDLKKLWYIVDDNESIEYEYACYLAENWLKDNPDYSI